MRLLHVAAMPFPTGQGTQAAVHGMCDALASAGHETHLLVYAHGAFARPSRYVIHRLPGLPGWAGLPALFGAPGTDALRSGPSLRKLVEDLAIPAEVRRLVRTLAPDAVLAHHVEAAAMCGVARVPFTFVAHTSLPAELPTYLPRALGPVARRAGARLDRGLTRWSVRAAAVSPALAEELRAQSGRPVAVLPIPWAAPSREPSDAITRADARRALGLPPDAAVCLYAGNLDAYQGVPTLLAAVRELARTTHAGVRLLVATGSPTAALLRSAQAAELTGRVHVAPLASEGDRARAHAAADVVAVPRLSPGGFPVKLLDAFARGSAVVLERRGGAGFPLDAVAEVVADDDPNAFAAGLSRLLADPTRRAALASSARAYVAAAHSPAAFTAAAESMFHTAAPDGPSAT